MEIIDNKNESGITVSLDDKHFVNCTYTSCTLIYSGGEYAWVDTKFVNCKITLAGAAQRTAALLGNMGVIPPGAVGGTPMLPKNPGNIQ